MSKYRVIGLRDNRLIVIRLRVSKNYPRTREMEWHRGRIRKMQNCVLCGLRFEVGTVMWQPLTPTPGDKRDRICSDCAEKGLQDIKEGI